MASKMFGDSKNKILIGMSPANSMYYGILVEVISPIDGRPLPMLKNSDIEAKKNMKTRAYNIANATTGQTFAIRITLTPKFDVRNESDGILSTLHIDGKHERCMYLSYDSWTANDKCVTQHHDFYSQYNLESGRRRNINFVFGAPKIVPQNVEDRNSTLNQIGDIGTIKIVFELVRSLRETTPPVREGRQRLSELPEAWSRSQSARDTMSRQADHAILRREDTVDDYQPMPGVDGHPITFLLRCISIAAGVPQPSIPKPLSLPQTASNTSRNRLTSTVPELEPIGSRSIIKKEIDSAPSNNIPFAKENNATHSIHAATGHMKLNKENTLTVPEPENGELISGFPTAQPQSQPATTIDDHQKRLFDLIDRLDKRSKKYWQNLDHNVSHNRKRERDRSKRSPSPSPEELSATTREGNHHQKEDSSEYEYPIKRVRMFVEERKINDYSDI